MTISKAALIDNSNIVQNLVQWTDDSQVPEGSGLTAIVVDETIPVSIGWLYNKKTKTFSDPNPYIPPTPTADQNKQTAVLLLTQTDWAVLPDVVNSSKKPYLTNQADFITYRNNLRKIATNPTEGILTWPVIPTASWSE